MNQVELHFQKLVHAKEDSGQLRYNIQYCIIFICRNQTYEIPPPPQKKDSSLQINKFINLDKQLLSTMELDSTLLTILNTQKYL